MSAMDHKQLLDILERLSRVAILRGLPGEEYHLYFHVPFSGLSADSSPLPNLDPRLHLTAVLCRNSQVLLAAGPCLSGISNALPEDFWDLMRWAGLMLLEDCCAAHQLPPGNLSPAETASYLTSKGIFQNCQSSVLRFQPEGIVIPQDLWPLLAAKGLLSENPLDAVPTSYGRSLGLLYSQTVHIPKKYENPQQLPPAERALRCSPSCWASLWEEHDSAWEVLSLDERLARLKQHSGGTNPGHFTAAVRRLMDMPLDVYMMLPAHVYPDYFTKDSKNCDILTTNWNIIQRLLGDLSAYTFVQALQKIDTLLTSPPTKKKVEDPLLSFATPIRTVNQIKALKRDSKSKQ